MPLFLLFIYTRLLFIIYYLLFIYYFGPFLLVAVFFSFFPFYFYFTFETRYGRYQSARARNRLPRVKALSLPYFHHHCIPPALLRS